MPRKKQLQTCFLEWLGCLIHTIPSIRLSKSKIISHKVKKMVQCSFTFSKASLEPTRHIAEIPHPTSSCCLSSYCFHAPVICPQNHNHKFQTLSQTNNPHHQTQNYKTRGRDRESTYMSSFWQLDKHMPSNDSSGCESFGDHISHRACVTCSSSYQSSLFPYPAIFKAPVIHVSHMSLHGKKMPIRRCRG